MTAEPTEPLAAVPVGELRKLAEVLSGLDIELADDYVAGLANRVLRDLARRWSDTVRVWAVEAELWGTGAPPGTPPGDVDLFLREAVIRAAEATGRTPAQVVAELAAHFKDAAPGG